MKHYKVLRLYAWLVLLIGYQTSHAQTSSLRKIRIESNAKVNGLPVSAYEVKGWRNLGTYPLTASGNAQWQNAIVSGQISLTVISNGCVIPAGTIPPVYLPTCNAPPSVTTTTPPSVTTTIAYNRVLIIGNSISGFTQVGDDRKGLAATTLDKDYVHILGGYLRTLNPNVQIRQFFQFSGVPNCGGLNLDTSDGPFWEGHYWSLPGNPAYCGFGGSDSLNRYQAAADYAADLIIIRLSENITDETHNLGYHYLRLINKLRSQNPSAQIVTTTSAWQGINAQQVTVSNIIKSVSAGNNFPCAELANIAGSTAGQDNHPNDAAMQTIADRIWAVVPKTTSTTQPPSTTTNVASTNKPSFDTFDYTPITSNNTWTSYDSRLHRGVPIGNKVVLDNDSVHVEIWQNFGGAPGHISFPGGPNIINQNDWGRGTGMTIYRGGRTRQVESQGKDVRPEWATPEGGGVGNNPLQIGDTYDTPAVATQVGRSGNTVYTRSVMMNWAVRNDPTDVVLQQWVTIRGYEVDVHTKMTHNRTGDQTQYGSRSNEYPNVIVNANYRYNAHVGPSGLVEYTIGGDQQPIPMARNWYAVVPANNVGSAGLGVWRAGGFSTANFRYAPDDTASDEFANPANYSVSNQNIIWDWNGTYYSHHKFRVGTVQQIKDWAEALPDPRNKLSWKFNNRNGRGYFTYGNGLDTGYPTQDTGIEVRGTEPGGFVDVKFPPVAIAASSVQNLYVRYKANGQWPSSNIVKVGRVGQTPIQYDSQNTTFSLTTDNAWHTVAIPVSSISGWSGTIQNVQFTALSVPSAARLAIQWINTVDADPEP